MTFLENLQVTLREISKKHEIGGCERCHNPNARLWPAMTAYDTHHLDMEVDPNPNGDVFLCDLCHDEYVEYWQEMWDEYFHSVL